MFGERHRLRASFVFSGSALIASAALGAGSAVGGIGVASLVAMILFAWAIPVCAAMHWSGVDRVNGALIHVVARPFGQLSPPLEPKRRYWKSNLLAFLSVGWLVANSVAVGFRDGAAHLWGSALIVPCVALLLVLLLIAVLVALAAIPISVCVAVVDEGVALVGNAPLVAAGCVALAVFVAIVVVHRLRAVLSSAPPFSAQHSK